MDNNQLLIVQLLLLSMNNRKFEGKIEANWVEILEISLMHEIHTLLYPLVRDIPISNGGPSPEILNRWREETVRSTLTQSTHINEALKVISAFNDNKIITLVLKGLVLRKYYPRSEYRMMSDIDILAKQEDMVMIRDILIGLGYTPGTETFKHVIFSKDNFLNIELHTRLANELFSEKTEEWEKRIWDRFIPIQINNVPTQTLSINDHLLFLCVHLANHIVTSGFGLRQLFDLALFIKKNLNDIDLHLLIAEAEEIGLKTFVLTLISACHKLFHIKFTLDYAYQEDEKMDILINDIFTGGLGNSKSHIYSSVYFVKLGERIKRNLPNRFLRVLYIIFPSYKVMTKKYTYIKKVPILLPIAWLHRILYNIFRKDKVLSGAKDYLALLKSHEVCEERYKLLKWLELI